MMLRVQKERHTQHDVDWQHYCATYQLQAHMIDQMPQEGMILHPGPVNRGVEISEEAFNHPKSRIFDQVRGGVFVRMALIGMLTKAPKTPKPRVN